jgi:predicted ArsR family transcriptional regulator
LQVLKDIEHPATSREISDALSIADPEVGRQLVRTRMAKLVEEGKVKLSEAEKGRAARLYSLS